MSTVQDNALGVVKYKHVDDSVAAESHGAQIRAQGEIIAERTYATRELVLCPREEFIISAIRRLVLLFRASHLQKKIKMKIFMEKWLTPKVH